MTVQGLAVSALAGLRLAAGVAGEVCQEAVDPAAHLLARLAVEADMARNRIEQLTADVRAAGRGEGGQ